jgi:hypothetical protein
VPLGDGVTTTRSESRFADAEMGEAAWHQDAAFEELRERAEALGAQIRNARSSLQGESGALDGVAHALSDLEDSILRARTAWQNDEPMPEWPKPSTLGRDAAPPRSEMPLPTPEAGPWDADTAEMLTRIWEAAATENHAATTSRARPSRPALQPSPPERETAQATAGLEARLAAIADRLQQALPQLDTAQWLAPIDERLQHLERQLTATLKDASVRAEPPSLAAAEAQIRAIASQVDETRRELARLEAMDERLREVMGRLEGLRPQSAETALSEAALASFAEAVAERTMDKLAPVLPRNSPPSSPADEQFEALEDMIRTYAHEARAEARSAAGVLQTLHHSVTHIIDRLEAADAGPGSEAEPESDPYGDRDLLMKAYADGARALGQTVPEPSSSDPAAPRRGSAWSLPREEMPEPDAWARHDAETHTLGELRASALRARLKAEAALEQDGESGFTALLTPGDDRLRQRGTRGRP